MGCAAACHDARRIGLAGGQAFEPGRVARTIDRGSAACGRCCAGAGPDSAAAETYGPNTAGSPGRSATRFAEVGRQHGGCRSAGARGRAGECAAGRSGSTPGRSASCCRNAGAADPGRASPGRASQGWAGDCACCDGASTARHEPVTAQLEPVGCRTRPACPWHGIRAAAGRSGAAAFEPGGEYHSCVRAAARPLARTGAARVWARATSPPLGTGRRLALLIFLFPFLFTGAASRRPGAGLTTSSAPARFAAGGADGPAGSHADGSAARRCARHRHRCRAASAECSIHRNPIRILTAGRAPCRAPGCCRPAGGRGPGPARATFCAISDAVCCQPGARRRDARTSANRRRTGRPRRRPGPPHDRHAGSRHRCAAGRGTSAAGKGTSAVSPSWQ